MSDPRYGGRDRFAGVADALARCRDLLARLGEMGPLSVAALRAVDEYDSGLSDAEGHLRMVVDALAVELTIVEAKRLAEMGPPPRRAKLTPVVRRKAKR